jgi:hypothetical protein
MLENDLQKLRKLVFDRRPVLKEIIEKHGHKSLHEYVKDYLDVNSNVIIEERQSEFLETFGIEVERVLGKEVAKSAVTQLKKYYFVSTADHMGPINHPFFVNSNLLIASSIFNNPDPVLKNVIVLACSNISIDNSSFPRGLFFHNCVDNNFQLHRLPFFSGNLRPASVYKISAYGDEELDKMFTALKDKLEEGKITQVEFDRVEAILKRIYVYPEVLDKKWYKDQICLTNFNLWKEFFSESKENLPNLIYVSLEDVVVNLLIKNHLNQDTIINHILFDPEYEKYISSYFEDIFGSFSSANASGTYLFWALPDGAKNKMQLWRKGDFLVTKDESYKIELKPDLIKEALGKKELIPCLLLDFMLVSLYYGVKCLGGFNQVNYLTMMKEGYIKMNEKLSNPKSIEVCSRVQTKELCDGLTMAFLGGCSFDKKILASGLDLVLYNDKNSLATIMEDLKQISLKEAFDPSLPEVYKISYDEEEWDTELTKITDMDVISQTEFSQKIKPCVSSTTYPQLGT